MSIAKKRVGILLSAFAFLGFLILPSIVLAEDPTDGSLGTACADTDGKPASVKCDSGLTCSDTTLKCVKDTFGLGPINTQVKGKLGNQDVRETAANLINVLLGILGLIAVVIVLAGGFKWMTAGGNDEKVGEARKMIFSGVIGLAIILSAWAISLFVINQLSTATGGEQPLVIE